MAENPRVIAQFKMHTTENPLKSRAAGRPIYDEMEVVEVHFAANKETVAVFPANAISHYDNDDDGTQNPVTYAERWPDQYRRFKENQQQIQEGTPLAELPFLSEAKRRELRGMKVFTAETLAALDGRELKNLGPEGRTLKNQAQAYLDAANGTASATRLAAENVGLKEQLAALQEQLREQAAAKVKGKVKAAHVEPDGDDEGDLAPTDTLDAMTDDEIKAFIKDRTGSAPRGQPARETLLRSARELMSEDA